MIGFSFNGVHSNFYDLHIKTIVPPIPPKPRYKEVKVIGKDGTYKFLDGYEDIFIQFDVLILGTISERREKIRTVGIWLQGEHNLVIDYDNLVVYKACLVDMVTQKFDINFEVLRITFSARLVV